MPSAIGVGRLVKEKVVACQNLVNSSDVLAGREVEGQLM